MEFRDGFEGQAARLAALFQATFSASENAEEGALIGDLVRDMLASTPPQDLRVFTIHEHGALSGAAIFSRMRYAQDPRRVFLLSPMAVASDRQGQGLGQALLRHALAALRAEGVDIAMTYGDPAFYGKLGFQPLSTATAPAPLPLSQPEGWIGQTLDGTPLGTLQGPARCISALNRPEIW